MKKKLLIFFLVFILESSYSLTNDTPVTIGTNPFVKKSTSGLWLNKDKTIIMGNFIFELKGRQATQAALDVHLSQLQGDEFQSFNAEMSSHTNNKIDQLTTKLKNKKPHSNMFMLTLQPFFYVNNDLKIINVLIRDYLGTGEEAHGITHKTVYYTHFDGSPLKVTKTNFFTKKGEKIVLAMIQKQFESRNYYKNIANYKRSYDLRKASIIFDKETCNIIYPEYVLAPYNYGPIEFDLKMEDIKDLLNPL